MKNSKSTCGRPRCNNKVGSHVDRKTGEVKVHKNCDACNAEYRAKLGLKPFSVASVKAKPKAQPKVEAKSQIASLEVQIQELKAALTRSVPTKAEQARASVEQVAKIVATPKAKPKAKPKVNQPDELGLSYASSADLYVVSASDELPF